jgi:CelD/BcsL family acetyltransferase involved in cellulose biosynthesis
VNELVPAEDHRKPGHFWRNYMRFEQFDARKNHAHVEQCWHILQENCPHHYFLSWGWISTWLNSLPLEQNIRFIAGFVDEKPMLAFFAGTTIQKHALLRSHIASLNSTGNPHFDKIYIEYNAVLAHPQVKLDIELFLHACKEIPWDELRLPGLSAQFVPQLDNLHEKPQKYNAVIEEIPPAFYIDLEKVRQKNMNYLGMLSANKRSQIRRSIKEYEKDGPIEITEAQTTQEALLFLERLAEYHQKEWQQRGKDGAFSNNYFFRFHRSLISQRFQHGEIQLLRIATPGIELGYLYNFVYQGWVYCYQSGFNYLSSNQFRPSLISDYFAILHNARLGHRVYDFMAGESEYKRSLSTDSEPMYWLRLIRSRPGFLTGRMFFAAKNTSRQFPVIYNLLKWLKNQISRRNNER